MKSTANFADYVGNSFHVNAVTADSQCRIVAGPFCVNAASTRLAQAYGDRWIAAGDAAQAFDPLSSQASWR